MNTEVRDTPLDASLELMAEALCHDAQMRGYDHGPNPTLMSFPPTGPAYCPRHLGIAQSVRLSLSKNWHEAEAASPAPDRGLDGQKRSDNATVLPPFERVLWPAGANWTGGKREVIVELKPIGVDGLCTGCGTKPSRETGSCRCLFVLAEGSHEGR